MFTTLTYKTTYVFVFFQELPYVWVGRVLKDHVQTTMSAWTNPSSTIIVAGLELEWFLLKEAKATKGNKRKGQLYGNLYKAEEQGSRSGAKRYMKGTISIPSHEILAIYEKEKYVAATERTAKDSVAEKKFCENDVKDAVFYAAVADRYKDFLEKEDYTKRYGAGS